MAASKNTKTFYLKKTLRNLSLIIIPAAMIYFAFGVLAGNLNPGLPPAPTMRTLEEIYNTLAGTFDSSATTANYNGSASQLTKCITRHIATDVGWYKTGGTWGYRKKITIDHTKVSNTNQTNFPVLVSITDTDLKDTSQASPGHVGQSDGGDIFFTSSNGTAKLSHEIEKYDNTTGNLIAWVKVPVLSVSADTVIYLYYGNASTANQWDTANVWDSNYKMVQHLSDATTSTTIDSTSNANNGTKLAANEPIETLSGQINEAQSFDGGNDYVDAGNGASLNITDNITVEAWIKPTIPQPRTWASIIDKKLSYGIQINGGTSKAFFELYVGSSQKYRYFNTVLINNWTLLTAVYTKSTGNIDTYTNGVLDNGASGLPAAGSSIDVNINNVIIGKEEPGGSNDFLGIIDEVRISSFIRSSDWITTEYNNQSSPETFYNLGSEENFGC